MPFNFMLWNCLLPDKTSIGEHGRRARLDRDRQGGECILVFQIDNAGFRKQFNLSQAKLCDALFFYSRPEGHPTLLPVELKGGDFATALEQLEGTVSFLAGKLPKNRTRYVPVIVSTSGVPDQTKKLRKTFSKTHGFEVRISRDGELKRFL